MDCAQAGGPRFQSATEETAPYTAVASVRKKEMLLPRFCADYILIFQGKHGKILNQMSQIQLIFFQEAALQGTFRAGLATQCDKCSIWRTISYNVPTSDQTSD